MVQCAGFESVLTVHALEQKHSPPLIQLDVHCKHLNKQAIQYLLLHNIMDSN